MYVHLLQAQDTLTGSAIGSAIGVGDRVSVVVMIVVVVMVLGLVLVVVVLVLVVVVFVIVLVGLQKSFHLLAIPVSGCLQEPSSRAA
tara:strand:- start:340 stop:600 length:261 start_codon:yes stop_codon:yes gene_type:complete